MAHSSVEGFCYRLPKHLLHTHLFFRESEVFKFACILNVLQRPQITELIPKKSHRKQRSRMNRTSVHPCGSLRDCGVELVWRKEEGEAVQTSRFLDLQHCSRLVGCSVGLLVVRKPLAMDSHPPSSPLRLVFKLPKSIKPNDCLSKPTTISVY